MTKNSKENTVLNAFQESTDRVAGAFKTVGNMEIPEAARDFVKRAAAVAKERVDTAHGEAEKATATAEGALNRSVGALASIVRSAEKALYQDAEAFFLSVTQLASAGSLSEAFKIQSDYMLGRGEVAVARAKAVAGYLGRPFSQGANSVQESLAKAA